MAIESTLGWRLAGASARETGAVRVAESVPQVRDQLAWAFTEELEELYDDEAREEAREALLEGFLGG